MLKDKKQEEQELSKRYSSRLDLPIEQWDKMPEDLDIEGWFKREVLNSEK